MRSLNCLVTCVMLAYCASSFTLAAAAVTPTAVARSPAALQSAVLQHLDVIRQQIYSFWQQYGPDAEYGGFHGTLDLSGAAIVPHAKGLVQQARHVWAFSTYHLMGYTRSALAASSRRNAASTSSQRQGQPQQHLQAEPPPTSREMAQTAFSFVVTHMRDPANGMFHWNVTKQGQLVQPNKVIYGQWFVLYSFSQYHKAFGDESARSMALQCFQALDKAWHNTTYGGYDELPENAIPPTPSPSKATKKLVGSTSSTSSHSSTDATRQSPTAARSRMLPASRGLLSQAWINVQGMHVGPHPQQLTAARREAGGGESPLPGALRALSGYAAKAVTASKQQQQQPEKRKQQQQQQQQQQPAVRTLNVAMHGLEALTALHKATKDPVVLQRVKEYVTIICTKLQRVQGLIFEDYLPSESGLWQPAPGSVVNYGHNLESTWLLDDTLDYLLSIKAISAAKADGYRATVMSIGAAAVRDGFDPEHGGIYESGSPTGGPSSKVKVWWVQAESMLALWKMHQYYDTPGLRRTAATTTSSSRRGRGSAGRQARQPPTYLEMLERTARFVRQHMTDVKGTGEQYWQVQPDGAFVVWNDIDKDTKGNRWKASYHNSRSVLFLEQYIKQQ